MNIKLKKLHRNAKLPIRGTMDSAAVDLYAVEDVNIYPNGVEILSCGWSIEIPVGYYAEIVPRSGLSCKKEVIILNSPCTIDSDYRGEVRTYMKNISSDLVKIQVGDRYAQMMIKEVIPIEFKEVDKLSETSRGSGGFGSTDK